MESSKVPEPLEDLAIAAILRAWVRAARPARRLAGYSSDAAIVLCDMQELLQCPCPRDDGGQWRSRLEQLRQEADMRERQLVAASRTYPTPAACLPIPRLLRSRWEAAAHSFFVELTSWHLYLHRINLLEDPSYEFVELFLSCAAVSWSGRLQRDATLLNVLDRSMFHEGLAMARLSQVGLGPARVRAAAERVLARLNKGAASTFPSGTSHLYVYDITRRVTKAVRLQYVTRLEHTPYL